METKATKNSEFKEYLKLMSNFTRMFFVLKSFFETDFLLLIFFDRYNDIFLKFGLNDQLFLINYFKHNALKYAYMSARFKVQNIIQ